MRFLGVLFFLLSLPVAAQQLTFVTEEQPPMNFTNPETGAIEGISTRLIRAMLEKADLSGDIQMMPWKRGFRLALSAPNTCIYTMVRTPEREAKFQWIGPLFDSGWAFYRRKGSDLTIESEEDLKGKVMSLTTGTREILALDKLEGVFVIEVASEKKALSLLYEGRADLWVSGVFTAFMGAEAAGVPTPELAYLWRPMELAVGCSPATDKQLVARMNAANRELDALRDSLRREYYYFSAAERP